MTSAKLRGRRITELWANLVQVLGAAAPPDPPGKLGGTTLPATVWLAISEMPTMALLNTHEVQASSDSTLSLTRKSSSL
jgi:hypothetical protein